MFGVMKTPVKMANKIVQNSTHLISKFFIVIATYKTTYLK